MKYRHYTPNEVVDLTRAAIHAFILRDLAAFTTYLDEDFTFVADDAPMFLRGKRQFWAAVQLEAQAPPAHITQEEYTLLAHERRLWVTFGRFQVESPPQSATIHFTFVWQQQENHLRLLHANAAHARPTALAWQGMPPAPQAHIFDPSEPAGTPPAQPAQEAPRRGYRDPAGYIRYLADGEILFFRSEGKFCWIHAAGHPPFPIRSGLGDMEYPGFLRIHRSYVVNLRYVQSIRRYRATLTDGRELPIGQEKYLALKVALAEAAE